MANNVGNNLAPLPIGPAIVNEKGEPTHEMFFWMASILKGVIQMVQVDPILAFAPSVTPAAGDPTVQAILERLLFSAQPGAQTPVPQPQTSFGPQLSGALQRISDLEKSLAFRAQTNQQQAQIIICTQATFPILNASNKNSFIYVTDYFHFIFWNGTTPAFSDGGSNYYIVADENPALGGTAAGGGWVPVDGSAGVHYLKADGTTGTRTLQNTVGTAAYLKVGTGASTLNAPVAPTIVMNLYTPAGTISTPTFSGVSATPAGTVLSFFTGTPKTWDVVSVATTVLTQSVLKDDGTNNPYTPAGTVASGFAGVAATPSGTISTPTFSGTPEVLTGTISSTAEPENLYSRLWYRI